MKVHLGMKYIQGRKKIKCKGQNGVGNCPSPVLCRDTTVVSRHAGLLGKACCDRVGSPCVAIRVFRVTEGFWVAGVFVSRHSFGVATMML